MKCEKHNVDMHWKGDLRKGYSYMKPTPETEKFYRSARQSSYFAQCSLSSHNYGMAAFWADDARWLWLQVEWEKQDEPR